MFDPKKFTKVLPCVVAFACVIGYLALVRLIVHVAQTMARLLGGLRLIASTFDYRWKRPNLSWGPT